MIEVPFRSWNTVYTLGLQAATPARIKTKTYSIIVLGKPPNVPTLCWLLYFYFWLTVPVSWAVSSQDVVLCFRVYPEKQLMTPLGSQTPIRLCLLTGQCLILLSGFFFVLVVVRECVCLGAGCQALNPKFTHTKYTLYCQVLPLLNKAVLHISGNGWIHVMPARSHEFRTLLLRKTPSQNNFHAVAGVLHKKPDSGEV